MICPLVLFRYRVSASRHFGHNVVHDRVERGRKGSWKRKSSFPSASCSSSSSIDIGEQKMKVFFFVKE